MHVKWCFSTLGFRIRVWTQHATWYEDKMWLMRASRLVYMYQPRCLAHLLSQLSVDPSNSMSFVTTSASSLKEDKAIYTAVESVSPSEEQGASDGVESFRVDGWPQGPQPLRGISLLKFLGDAFLVILPIPFLGADH
jgi:hypothetical protein